jgi:hypothetical protein
VTTSTVNVVAHGSFHICELVGGQRPGRALPSVQIADCGIRSTADAKLKATESWTATARP